MTNNKNMQFTNGLSENRMPSQQQDQRNFWPDDPAIVSLTDRSHSLANGNFNGLNNGVGLGKSFNELQYQLANNNNNNRSLSPSFLNTLSSLNNNNNKNQSNINSLKLNQPRLNGEQQQQLQQQQQQFLNNQYFQNFNNKLDDNLNNLAQPFLNRLQSFNNLNGLNTNSNDNNTSNNNNNGYPNNLFSTNLLNDQLSQLVVNQDNGINTLNMASLSLHQQFLMQQLTANFAAKKLQSE